MLVGQHAADLHGLLDGGQRVLAPAQVRQPVGLVVQRLRDVGQEGVRAGRGQCAVVADGLRDGGQRVLAPAQGQRAGLVVQRPGQVGQEGVRAGRGQCAVVADGLRDGGQLVLARVGFTCAPRFLGRYRRGRDVLTFLDGAIAGDPVEPWATADDPLAGVGALLRRLHDASEPWAVPAGLAFGRDLRGGSPPQLPAGPRLVSHNDVTPQNVVVRGGVAVGLIDFDLAGWTTRLVELANTGMHWVPLSDPGDRDPAYDGADIPGRLRLLVDGYGLDRGGRAGLLDAFAVRLSGLYDRMHWNAENVGVPVHPVVKPGQ